MTAPSGTTSFGVVSAITELGPGRFGGEVSGEWTIGDKPNGGYLLAMLGRAAVAVGAHSHPLAASAHYLRAPDPGPVEIHAEALRTGRSASQVRASMLQGDRPCVEALFTIGELGAGAAPVWSEGLPSPGGAPIADGVRLPGTSPTGMRVGLMDQLEVRIDPDSTGFMALKPTGRGELRGWLSFPGAAPFDPVSLLLAVDSFPPASFDIERTGWVPTLELTAYVRALPAPGPLRVLQRAQLITGGRMDEVCFVWDSEGTLVAQGTQLAGIRLG